MSLLELRQVSKSYGEGETAVLALEDINLSSTRATSSR